MSLLVTVTSQELLLPGWFKQARCLDISKLLNMFEVID